MSGRSSDRSPSPLVFMRHPHSFVPVSGQNIPPPPHWKPPPLPRDVDDSSMGGIYSETSSIKSRQTESVSSEGDYLIAPTLQCNQRDISNDTPILNSPSPSSINITPMNDLKGAILTYRRRSSATLVRTTPDEGKRDNNTPDNLLIPTNECGSLQRESPNEISKSVENGAFQGDLPTPKEDSNLTTDNLHVGQELKYIKPEVTTQLDSRKDHPSLPAISTVSVDDDNNADQITLTEGATVSETNISSAILTKETAIKSKKSKRRKKDQKKSSGSITISKLEEELDSLPIPEFPTLGVEHELDILPMSEFPVPEPLVGNKLDKPQDSMQSDKVEETLPEVLTSQNKVIESNKHIQSNETNPTMIENVHVEDGRKELLLSDTEEILNKKQDEEMFSSRRMPSINGTTNHQNGNIAKNTFSLDLKVEETEYNASPSKDLLNKSNKNVENDRKNEDMQELEEQAKQQESPAGLTRTPSKKYKRVAENTTGETAAITALSNPTTMSTAAESIKPAKAVLYRIKDRVNNDRRNSLVKTLTRLEPHLLVASSLPGGIRSQRLAELGVSCVVHATTVLGAAKKGVGFITSHSDGIDIINANLEDGGNNFNIFDAFSDKILDVQRKKGVALVISDESSPSFNQREGTASSLCIAYMLKHKGMTLDHALNKIKSNRPEIQPSPFNCFQLQEYEQHIIDMKKYNSKFGCLSALLNGKYFEGRQDVIEKISHNWIQLIIYFLVLVFLIRFTMHAVILMFYDDDDSEEKGRLPCS